MFFNARMTLSFRNGLLTFLLVAAGIIGGFSSYAVLIAGQSFGWNASFPVQEKIFFWFWTISADQTRLGGYVWQFVFLIPIVLVGLFYLRLLFRKTSAPEVFFLSFFLFSLLGETLRIFQVFFVLGEQSFFLGVVLTRIIWVFRLFGIFMFFAASLFSLEFNYQKFGNFVGLSLGLALFLGVNLTLQTTILDSNGLYAPGDERGLAFTFLILGTLTLVNFAFSAFFTKKAHGTANLAASFLFFLASQAIYFVVPWAPLLLIPATGFLGRKIEETYL